jgi:hypothetical protein
MSAHQTTTNGTIRFVRRGTRLVPLAALGACLCGVLVSSSPAATSPYRSAIRFLAPRHERGIGGFVTVFALPMPLRSGTVIDAADGGMRRLTVKRRARLFWEDLGHGVLFPHPSILLLLDAKSGAVLAERRMTSFPLIDGRAPPFLRTSKAYLGALDAVYDRRPLKKFRLAGRSPASVAAPDFSADGMVTVGARDDPALQYDFTHVDEYAKDLKLDNVAAEPSAKGLTDAIGKLADQGKTDILIFLGGHGYAAPGEGRSYTDDHGQQISEPESKAPKILLKDNGDTAELITAGELARIIGKFPKLTFKVVIDSCHSGRWLDPIGALSNVKVILTSTDIRNVSTVGFGAAIFHGLQDWAATPGATDLVSGLRVAFDSQPMKNWISGLPDVLHPQISPSKTLACSGAQFQLFDNWNGDAVSNGGTPPSFSTEGKRYCLISISTYHWNGGQGATPGTISLVSSTATLGPWQATGSPGQPTMQYPGGVPNANWTVTPGSPTAPVLIDGSYTCNDSDPSTWSQDSTSAGLGFCKVYVEAAEPG